VSSTPPGTFTTVSVSGSGGGSVADPAPHWEGDVWVDGDYRVERKWCELYPDMFGPLSKDPDEGQGEVECDDLISRFLNKFTGAGGTFSTWTERHAFIIASQIGYLCVKSSADVPPVPKFFLHESHYWRDGIIVGRGAAKVEGAAPSLKAYAGIFAAGGISIAAVLKYALPMIGVSV